MGSVENETFDHELSESRDPLNFEERQACLPTLNKRGVPAFSRSFALPIVPFEGTSLSGTPRQPNRPLLLLHKLGEPAFGTRMISWASASSLVSLETATRGSSATTRP